MMHNQKTDAIFITECFQLCYNLVIAGVRVIPRGAHKEGK